MAGKHGVMRKDKLLSHRMAIMENTTMANYSDKHYELLATTVKRYLEGVGDDITLVELGKAINMIVEMVERESMRDDREARNK
jgi:hypothetical protein